ncbi:MAG TPA: ATP-binding cassette domain-containing protein [Dermatophilaceae bacterium]|nr:ATP-binding cassette domain-containing protein [Dermatophilaceae bacterium]
MPTEQLYHGRHRSAQLRQRPLPLAATGITLDIGERRILDDVSLSLAPGSFTALTGPSGAGKSTLLWVLAGSLAPSAGAVTYAGRPTTSAAAATEGIVLVPQSIALVDPLTARENVVVPLMVVGVPADEAHERADAALEQVQLADSGNHLVEELSGGQEQRVAVGRALALRASVLLADEPTSELDAATRETIVGLLRAEAGAGAVVLMATHDDWCADQADAEYHLDEGRLRRVR